MVLKKLLILLFVSATFAFAAGETNYDIIPRTVNFLIFASLVYYLAAEPIKNLFAERKESIANSFEQIEEKLKEAESQKELAKKSLENAKTKAAEIVEYSKEEAQHMKQKLIAQNKSDVEVLHKQKEEAKVVAKNHMMRDVVKEELEKIFDSPDLKTDSSDILDSLIKKVA